MNEATCSHELIKEEDARDGRVIPRWRYNAAYIASLVGVALSQTLPEDFWWLLVSMMVATLSFPLLLATYKKRGIAL